MNLPFFIARRHLFSRKQKSVINIISWISFIGIAVSTMALIIVLSVYNGIGNLTQGLFNVFDPELKVEPVKGKSFHLTDIDEAGLRSIKGVATYTQLVEENAWITHKHNDAIVTLRGVDSLYGSTTSIDTMVQGHYLLRDNTTFIDPETGFSQQQLMEYVIVGSEIYYRLGLHATDNSPIAVHIPRRNTAIGLSMDEAFNSGYAMPSGTFFIQQEIDSRYVLAHIDFVRSLLDYSSDQCTALSIVLDGSRPLDAVKADVKQLLGSDFSVRDRFDQQPLYYKVFRSERLGIYLILALIILISTLNLVASLSLLIIDKQHDISTLRSMGMTTQSMRRMFFEEGLLISAVGIAAGLLLGFVVCFLQQQFGLIRMGDNFVVSAFPVAMRGIDFLATFLLVAFLSSIAVFLTTRHARI